MTTPHPRTFVKSSFSTNSGGNCVEWAPAADGVFVRDSKNPTGPEVRFTHDEWAELTARAATDTEHPGITAGEYGVTLAGPGGHLHFSPAEWAAFTAAIRAGECHRCPVG